MQREHPGVTMEQFEQRHGHRPTYLSGGPISGFVRGWAKAIWLRGERAHYFVSDNNADGEATALCGVGGDVYSMLGPGNYPRCKSCQKQEKPAGAGE